MHKKYLLIVLIITVLILAGCNDNGGSDSPSKDDMVNQEIIELEHLLTPYELEVFNPEVNRKNQEIYSISMRVIEEFNAGRDLSEEQMEEYEKLMDSYTTNINAIEEQVFKIQNPDVISGVFDRVRDSKAVASEYLNDERIEESNYYHVEVSYENESSFGKRLEDGYITSLTAFEDNTLVIVTWAGERNQVEIKEIKIEFDYELFQKLINE